MEATLTNDARRVALEILRRVFQDQAFAASTLRAAFARHRDLHPADKGLVTELVYGVLRRRGLLDRAIRAGSSRRLEDIDKKLLDVLRLGAYQLLYLDRVPDHAAVSTAVQIAKQRRGPRAAAFVNAVLRGLLRLPEDERFGPTTPLEVDPVAHVFETGSLPRHLAARLVEDLGPEEAAAFAQASLHPATLSLRANLLRTTQAALAAEVGGSPGALPASVRIPSGAGVLPANLPCVREGRATPQDEAAMRVVLLLDPQPGERVLDLCAAPGGKTTFAAERMNDEGQVVAHDRLPDRLQRVADSATRLGLSIVETKEALPPTSETYDRVLVDAPCSGLGTLRRHPEIRWRFTDKDLAELTRTQAQVLREGAERTRPGGTLVYSTCTVTRVEGEQQVAKLKDDFRIEEIVRTGPHQEGAPDGFFAARLVKKA